MRTEDTELMYWHMSKAAEFDEETQDDEMWFHLVKAVQLGADPDWVILEAGVFRDTLFDEIRKRMRR